MDISAQRLGKHYLGEFEIKAVLWRKGNRIGCGSGLISSVEKANKREWLISKPNKNKNKKGFGFVATV